jgi:5-carboxymethyl-2-hydroxymuconate isomerase
MPHLRLEVPEEWLREDFRLATGFDAKKLLDRLVEVVAGLRMEKPDTNPASPELVPFINLSNLKHAIVPLYHAHVAGDASQRFLHATLSAGNDTPGRTAAVRRRVAQTLGDEIDRFVSGLQGLTSVTVHLRDIDRDRGYSTTGERKKARDSGSSRSR